jgi:hypothetical protein
VAKLGADVRQAKGDVETEALIAAIPNADVREIS